MSKWKDNLFYRVLSILLAIGLWWYVSDQQNPVTERVFNIPVEVRGLADQLVVAEKPERVQVRVQGNKRVMQEVSSRDMNAWVELRGTKAGERIAQVNVNLPRGVDLVNVVPAQARIVLDMITEIQLPVKVKLDAVEVAEGYTLLPPFVEPSQVLVSGPEKTLEDIEELFVQPEAHNVTSDISGVLPVQIKNNLRETLHGWLRVVPSTAEVFVPVIPELPAVRLPLVVPLEGTPPEGYEVTGVKVTPETAFLYAPQSLLHELEVISTDAVDVSGMTKQEQLWVELDLPDGTYSSVGSRVYVTIEILEAENTIDGQAE